MELYSEGEYKLYNQNILPYNILIVLTILLLISIIVFSILQKKKIFVSDFDKEKSEPATLAVKRDTIVMPPMLPCPQNVAPVQEVPLETCVKDLEEKLTKYLNLHKLSEHLVRKIR